MKMPKCFPGASTCLFLLTAQAGLFCQTMWRSVFDSTSVTQSTEVYFVTGKYDLSPESNASIDSVANFFKAEKRSSKIRITAHTDSVGKAEANKLLSEKRAHAVREALKNREIAENAIETTAFGENRPATANSDEQGRQRNRRATLDVLLTTPMKTLSGKIRDSETGKGIEATIIFSAKDFRSDSIRTDTSGQYSVRLPQDLPVKMDVFARDYFFESQVVKLFGSPEMQRKMKSAPGEIALKAAKSGEKIAVKNLFFVGNEAILLKTSEPELPKILKFMQINPGLKIEIGGHINQPMIPPGKLPAWEQRLSERRAELVYNYLLQNGIPAERMAWKGYGNAQMLFPKGGTEAQQEQNRRVEIKVLN